MIQRQTDVARIAARAMAMMGRAVTVTFSTCTQKGGGCQKVAAADCEQTQCAERWRERSGNSKRPSMLITASMSMQWLTVTTAPNVARHCQFIVS